MGLSTKENIRLLLNPGRPLGRENGFAVRTSEDRSAFGIAKDGSVVRIVDNVSAV